MSRSTDVDARRRSAGQLDGARVGHDGGDGEVDRALRVFRLLHDPAPRESVRSTAFETCRARRLSPECVTVPSMTAS